MTKKITSLCLQLFACTTTALLHYSTLSVRPTRETKWAAGPLSTKKSYPPDFFILGGAASEADRLYHCVIQHPLIKPLRKECQGYFLFAPLPSRSHTYAQLFPYRSPKELSGEANALYLSDPDVAERIKQMCPNAKFIVLLHDPIENSFVWYQKIRRHWRDPNHMVHPRNNLDKYLVRMTREGSYLHDDFATIVEREIQLIKAGYPIEQGVVHNSLYIEHLRNWFSVFPKKNFLFLSKKELLSNPHDITAKVFSFLKLGPYKITIQSLTSPSKFPIDKSTNELMKAFFKPYTQDLVNMIGNNV